MDIPMDVAKSENENSDATSSDSEDELEEDVEEEETVEDDDRPNVYLPGQPLKDDEELVCDQSAYVMLHQAQTGSPCLSFDVIKDISGEIKNPEEFPLTCYLVAGTQAPRTHANNVIVMKLSNLHRAEDDESDEDEESDDDEDEGSNKYPEMTNVMVKHLGCVNRIRATRWNETVLAATWSELGRVNIWNLTEQMQLVENRAEAGAYNKSNAGNNVSPLFSFGGHQQEGFAIDWCQTTAGVLATGDCKQDIHIWKPAEGGVWQVDQRPLVGHKESVEDLQWSPNEPNVLASCSVDKSIRIWDTRVAPHKACMIAAENVHESDINVISWSQNEPFIVSGGDDGFLHIWDLRQFQTKTPVATFKHHIAAVTTVEWHPTEPTVFGSGGSDNQIALWDLSVEKDTEENTEEDLKDIPPQLLFIHQGQTDVKELHWHPQLPGVMLSTAQSGFNIFKTISV